MRFKAIVVLLAVGMASAADNKAQANDKGKATIAADKHKTYTRLIPADVLRDFPGRCFGSTKCLTFESNESWDLSPFCGRSSCIKKGDQLWELVEDCGPLPKPNDKCKLSEKTNKTASFPDCCPLFECEEGVKLEYPEIPTPSPDAAPAKPSAPGDD